MGKLLTIVIPTYNMEGLLDNCLASLVVPEREHFVTLEVLVVIDGATDNSSSIAHKYEEKYPDVFRVIDKDNGNYGSCVNRGLAEAKGKYIKILDADDKFDTQALDLLLVAIHTLDVDLVLTNYCICDTNGGILERKSFKLPYGVTLLQKDLGSLGSQMAMHAVAYKAEILRDIKYHQTEGISYTDQEWIYEPMTAVKSFIYLDLFPYQYTIGRDGQTMDFKALSRNMHHNLIVLRKLISIYNTTSPESDIYEYLRRRIERYAEYVYSLYLFHMKQMNIEHLVIFDKELKHSCAPLYNFIGSLRAGKLPHVKLWRMFYYTDDHGLNNFFRYRRYRLWCR